MPEPDCFLLILCAATRNFITSGKSHVGLQVSGARRCSDAWFENGFIRREPWDNTEVRVLYRVPFYS